MHFSDLQKEQREILKCSRSQQHANKWTSGFKTCHEHTKALVDKGLEEAQINSYIDYTQTYEAWVKACEKRKKPEEDEESEDEESEDDKWEYISEDEDEIENEDDVQTKKQIKKLKINLQKTKLTSKIKQLKDKLEKFTADEQELFNIVNKVQNNKKKSKRSCVGKSKANINEMLVWEKDTIILEKYSKRFQDEAERNHVHSMFHSLLYCSPLSKKMNNKINY